MDSEGAWHARRQKIKHPDDPGSVHRAADRTLESARLLSSILEPDRRVDQTPYSVSVEALARWASTRACSMPIWVSNDSIGALPTRNYDPSVIISGDRYIFSRAVLIKVAPTSVAFWMSRPSQPVVDDTTGLVTDCRRRHGHKCRCEPEAEHQGRQKQE